MKKVGTVIAGFLLIVVYACQDSGSRHPSTKPVIFTSDSVMLAYKQTGQGDTTVLLLHGWGINQTYWDNQVSYLEKEYQVVTLDLPGFGKSGNGRKKYTIEQYGQDISLLIKELALKNVILVGHSMSGDIILETAIHFPDNIIGMVGIDNFKDVGYDISGQEEEETNQFLSMLESDYANISKAYAEGYLFHPSTDSVIRDRVVQDISQVPVYVAVSSFRQLLAYTPKERTLLRQLSFPLFLINSDAVPTDEAGLGKYCPSGYRLFPIPSTGHYPMLEATELFNQQLRAAIHAIGSATATEEN